MVGSAGGGEEKANVGAKLVPTSRIVNSTWTRTGPAGYVDADSRIAVEGVDAAIAVVPGGGVSAVDASTGPGIAAFRVSVALAALAVREIPESRLTLATGSAVGVRSTLATPGLDVAEVIEGSDRVAVAGYAALRSETVSARSTVVAPTADDVRFARTTAAVVLAQKTVRSGRIALASCNRKLH